jgi:thiol:disulfide interchange protein DsbD
MTKNLLFIVLLFTSFTSFAQGEKRIKFTSCFKKTAEGKGEIIITGKIEEHFHVFAFNPGGDGSQIPTTLTFSKNPNITFVGKTKEEGKLINEEIKVLDIIINYYKNEVKYIQPVTYKKLEKGSAKIHFQICNETMCERETDVIIPFDLNNNCDGSKTTQVATTDTPKVAIATTPTTTAKPTDTVNPNTGTNTNITTTSDTNIISTSTTANNTDNTYGEFGTIVGNCGEAQESKLSAWKAFLFGLLGGLAALFFPCTLPMIPMTISFFLKGSDDKKKGVRNGIMYGFFIFLVYFLLSLPFLFLNIGGNALNDLSTNVWVNLLFFIIFIVFAISLFGFFDISLPSGLASKVDAKSNAKNIGGIFFMALTLAIVSFSCTGPILGLVLGNVGNPSYITLAMSGFGIGLGVPFALFAIFPNLLKALPKSGGWLTTLKYVFGFIEVAFALKFLSNVDLVLQLGLLKRETFLIIWVLILILMGLYLLGKFTLKKGYENNPAGMPSKVLAIISFAFAAYVGSDLFGFNPNLFGFPPPAFYSYMYKEEKLKNGTEAKTHLVKGLTVYTNLEDALEEGKKQNKPVMIDFTGWACVNCRKMEEIVWPNLNVYKTLNEKYIIVSLYVDDKRMLPAGEQFQSEAIKKVATTIGDKWTDVQIKNFRNAGQPFYALIDAQNHRILNTPRPYTPNATEYNKWLECGISNFNSLRN